MTTFSPQQNQQQSQDGICHDFCAIGNSFVGAYYAQFDVKESRRNVINFYNPQCLMSFEGDNLVGPEAVYNKLTNNFKMGNIQRTITTIDCHPMQDIGVMVNVIGQLKGTEEGDKPLGFTQVFVLCTTDGGKSYYIKHDIFRLAVYNIGV